MDNKLPPIYFNIRVVVSKALSRYLTGSLFCPENFVVCVCGDIKKTSVNLYEHIEVLVRNNSTAYKVGE